MLIHIISCNHLLCRCIQFLVTYVTIIRFQFKYVYHCLTNKLREIHLEESIFSQLVNKALNLRQLRQLNVDRIEY